MFVVYTEIIGKEIERWFYGRYTSYERANEVALALGGEYPIYHCVCKEEDIVRFGIRNC